MVWFWRIPTLLPPDVLKGKILDMDKQTEEAYKSIVERLTTNNSVDVMDLVVNLDEPTASVLAGLNELKSEGRIEIDADLVITLRSSNNYLNEC